ncbi:unnamed protein product [Rotaria magnacalcarata]|uniref:Uncharacterized protein n=4 Tax=Rotaria magnacalcarata TaxID=392030 RepID=A0A8S2S315_9BILA|nr:unnamed protein product [Rotaria magnacalcarata]
MPVDSISLFADVRARGGSEIPCKYLSTSLVSINNHSFLLGCKTQIESLLLHFGKFDMPPCNIEEFHVCSNHSNITYASRFKNCCLCKPLGRSKSSNSGLRIVTKLYAFAAWKQFKFRLSFGRKMCTPCRRNLDNKKRFCRQSTKIFKSILGFMTPHDDTDRVWEGLTAYRFYKARQHADFEGKRTVVDDTRGTTIRYDDYQLEHFIEFLVSPHICTDLPFGKRELHPSTGETLLIPLTIRNLAPKRIIVQYYNYCKEYYGDVFHPLDQSTLFGILNECSASTRRSLQGLASFSAEGSTAFDLLISIVDTQTLSYVDFQYP